MTSHVSGPESSTTARHYSGTGKRRSCCCGHDSSDDDCWYWLDGKCCDHDEMDSRCQADMAALIRHACIMKVWLASAASFSEIWIFGSFGSKTAVARSCCKFELQLMLVGLI
jgi:hypothetical protein